MILAPYIALHAASQDASLVFRQDLLPVRIDDGVAPDYARAKFEVNLAVLGANAWDFQRFIKIDECVAIVSGDYATPLFFGIVADPAWQFSRSQSATVTAVSRAYLLARLAEHQVYGRYMRTAGGEDALFSGLPCAFNAGGKPNMSAYTTLCSSRRRTGNVQVHLFTYDGDPDAAYWTFEDAANYLMWMYNRDEQRVGNAIMTPSTTLAKPIICDVEGMGLWDALGTICKHGGYDCREVLSIAGTRIESTISLVKWGEGTEIIIQHQAPDADGVMPTLDTEQTNIFAADVSQTASSCVTAPIILGGREIREITVELGKAWSTPAYWSSVKVIPPGLEDQCQKDYTYYYGRFIVGDINFYNRDHAFVGRLWDANTDGKFASLPTQDIAALAGDSAGSWPKMPYKALPMLSRIGCDKTMAMEDGLRRSSDVLVEWSHDAGTTWNTLTGGYMILPDRLGVYLTVKNLASIVPYKGNQWTHNLFQLLLDSFDTVKMRLTCAIALPNRRVYRATPTAYAGTAYPVSAIFDRGTLCQVKTRAASSRYASTNVIADTTDAEGVPTVPPTGQTVPAATMAQYAADVQARLQRRRIDANLTLEWIEPMIELGGVVRKIAGIEVDLTGGVGDSTRWPRIVKRTFLLTPDTCQTTFTLDSETKGVIK